MASKISNLTDGATKNATDRIPVARSPFNSSDNRYLAASLFEAAGAAAAAQAASQPLDSDLTTLAAAITAAGHALMDDANAAAQRTTLGLGTLATQSGTFSGTSSGTNTGDQTNISGNAATVTTNANLTGHVTSSGNAAVLGTFSLAQLNTAISDADVATGGGTATGTNTGDNTAFAAPLGADDNYVTDAEKTVIAATSGSNTGDASGHGALATLASPAFTGVVSLGTDNISAGQGYNKIKQAGVAGGFASQANGNSNYIKMYHDDSYGYIETTYVTDGGYTPLRVKVSNTVVAEFASTGLNVIGAIECDNTVGAAIGIASTHKVTMVINGTTYYLLASNV